MCHPWNRHVLAGAVPGGSQAWSAEAGLRSSFNLRDFPAESVQRHDIGVVTPDACLLDQLYLYPARVGRALRSQLDAASRPSPTWGQCSAS